MDELLGMLLGHLASNFVTALLVMAPTRLSSEPRPADWANTQPAVARPKRKILSFRKFCSIFRHSLTRRLADSSSATLQPPISTLHPRDSFFGQSMLKSEGEKKESTKDTKVDYSPIRSFADSLIHSFVMQEFAICCFPGPNAGVT